MCVHFFLPIVIQLGGEGGATTDNELTRRLRMVFRVGSVAILPITISFPSVSVDQIYMYV